MPVLEAVKSQNGRGGGGGKLIMSGYQDKISIKR